MKSESVRAGSDVNMRRLMPQNEHANLYCMELHPELEKIKKQESHTYNDFGKLREYLIDRWKSKPGQEFDIVLMGFGKGVGWEHAAGTAADKYIVASEEELIELKNALGRFFDQENSVLVVESLPDIGPSNVVTRTTPNLTPAQRLLSDIKRKDLDDKW